MLRSSILTAYRPFDEKANSIAGMLIGGIAPVEMSAAIGPLLHSQNETQSFSTLRDAYYKIMEIVAPSLDIVWIQPLPSLICLDTALDAAKAFSDEEQIWVSLSAANLLGEVGSECLDLLMKHRPGSVIVVGNDWRELNLNLVLLSEYATLEGGTKFGLIVDDERTGKRERGRIESNVVRSKHIDIDSMHDAWRKAVGDDVDVHSFWDDELLEKASRFWIEQGVAIIGCEWEQGLRVVHKTAHAWNQQIGR